MADIGGIIRRCGKTLSVGVLLATLGSSVLAGAAAAQEVELVETSAFIDSPSIPGLVCPVFVPVLSLASTTPAYPFLVELGFLFGCLDGDIEL